MANSDHVQIVKQGRRSIEQWRSDNPGDALDLSGADLRRVELTYCDLSEADFSDCDLQWADFRWADLSDALFDWSNLERADFHKAALARASFIGARLVHANFEDADLSDAEMNEAALGFTRFLNTDLRTTLGLSECEFEGPCLLDRDTLVKNPELPDVFLHGVGYLSSYGSLTFRVAIGSPADVPEERATLRDVINTWNENYSFRERAVFVPAMWERTAPPLVGQSPQDIIDKNLLRSCQALICVFWTRLGTQTGDSESGTVHEIEQFVASGRPVLIYFSKRDIPLGHDAEQLRRLKEFRAKLQESALIYDFETVHDLATRFTSDLTRLLDILRPGTESK